MKISMWNLADRLAGYRIRCYIQEGKDTIRSIRWLTGEKTEPDIVYVSRSTRSVNTQQEGEALIVHRNDIIRINESDADVIFNVIIDTIDYFNLWEEQVKKFVGAEDGLQQMMDISYDLLQTPSFVYNTSGEVLAITNRFGPECHWHWAELLENGRITDKRFREFKGYGNFTYVYTDKTPVIRHSSIDDFNYAHCALFVQDNRVGHFVSFDFVKPFQRGISIIIKTLVAYMQKHMEYFYSQYQPHAMVTVSFIELLEQRLEDESLLQSRIDDLKWSIHNRYQICVIKECVDAETVLLARVYSILANTLLCSYTFIYQKDIVVITNVDMVKTNINEYNEKFKDILSDGFYCCFSNVFYDLRDLALFYEQAHIALHHADSDNHKFIYVHDLAYQVIMQAFTENKHLYTFSHEALFALIHYDKENNTQYYETLKCFVKKGCRFSETSNTLAIHRNTLIYRLKKINDLVGVDGFLLLDNAILLEYLVVSFLLIDYTLNEHLEL